VTDDGTKKSAKGLMQLRLENGRYQLLDDVSREEEMEGELKEVFRDGKLLVELSLADIRRNIRQLV